MRGLKDPIKEQAAQLIAEARYEYGEIAEKVGVDRVTLHRWRKNEKFAARVDQLREELNDAALQRAIARKQYRIGVLADRHSSLLQVIEERAADVTVHSIAGAKTGLLVRSIVASAGEKIGYDYAVDTGTLKELRAIEEQVAKELGQIVDKRELTGKDGGPLTVAAIDAWLDDDEDETESGAKS